MKSISSSVSAVIVPRNRGHDEDRGPPSGQFPQPPPVLRNVRRGSHRPSRAFCRGEGGCRHPFHSREGALPGPAEKRRSPRPVRPGLPGGERISVVVDRLQPEVLFRIAGRAAPAAGGMPEFLAGMRTGTCSLFRLFTDAAGLLSFSGASDSPGSPGSGRTDPLLSIIRTLILSKETLRDPLFIRNFIFASVFSMKRRPGAARLRASMPVPAPRRGIP